MPRQFAGMNISADLSPTPYVLILTEAGFLIALVAWLPLALRRVPLLLPILCIGIGAAISLCGRSLSNRSP